MNNEKCKMQKEVRRRPNFCLLTLSLFICHFLSTSQSFAQTFVTDESRFLTGLRERQLFELAESFCRRELGKTYVVRRRRAELTIELSRTILESALYEKPPKRDERFAAAAKVLDQAAFEGPDDPWRVAVGVQRGLIDLVQGELLREEAQSLNAHDSAMTAARDRLRSAVTQLRKSLTAVEELQRTANRVGAASPAKPDEPTAAEAVALKRHVDYQLARAYRNQGESYPAGSPDRASALDQATKALELLARSESADDLTWQARLDEVVCRRLLGDLDGAERMLGIIDGESPPSDVAEQARAQRIRIHLDAALLDEAKKVIHDADVDGSNPTSPEVQLAVLEWMLASSQAATKAGRTNDATDWQNRAAALTKLIAERHSAHWARRAESLLASNAATTPTGDVALLIKAAESFYQQGNIDRALEVYERAYEKARETKDDNAAMTIGLTSAAIELQSERRAVAASRLLSVSKTFPNQPRAAEAHLTGVALIAEQAARENNRDLLAKYAQLLTEHVVQWPTDATSSKAHLWIGLLRKSEQNYTAAVTALVKVSPDSPSAMEAVDALIACWDALLSEKNAAGQPLPILEMERSLTMFAPGLLNSLADAMSPTVRRAAWGAAKLWLRFAHDRYAQAAAVLTRLRETTESDAERASADAWLTVCDVGLQRDDAALERAKQISTSLSETDAAVIDALDALTLTRPAEARPKIAAVTLRMAELGRTSIGVQPRAEARALTIVGRAAEARQLWDKLSAAASNDIEIQAEYAEFLLSQPDRESAAAAVAKWRTVERASKESAPRWYQARLGLAKAYLKSGDKARAAQLIELTTALHPDLGGEALKRQFESLGREIAAGR